MLEKLTNFLKDVRAEMKKVTWPTKDQTVNYTIIVIGISVGVAVFLGAFDYIFRFIINTFVI